MAKKESSATEPNLTTEKKSKDTKQFIKDNWPILAGIATIAGAAVYLTAKYLKKHRSKIPPGQLDQISEEAIGQETELHAFLETGSGLTQIAGSETTSQAAQELAEQTDDPNLKEALETLAQSSMI